MAEKTKPETTVPPMPDEPGGGGVKPAKPAPAPKPAEKGGESED